MGTTNLQRRYEVFSGFAMGILIGGIIGLSVSQVVGIVLGALTSLLAAFFGLKPESEKTNESNKKLLMIGVFCFSCIFGIIGGIYCRTHDYFSSPIYKEIKKWTNAGYSNSEAKNIVLYQETGCVFENNTEPISPDTSKHISVTENEKLKVGTIPMEKHTVVESVKPINKAVNLVTENLKVASTQPNIGVEYKSILMSGTYTKALICARDIYPNFSEYLNAYRLSGKEFKMIADSVVGVTKDTVIQKKLLQTIKNILCK